MIMTAGDDKVALIAGATSLVGLELVRLLLSSKDWKLVYGVARKAPARDEEEETKFRFVSCDLLDRGEVMANLSPLSNQVTHLFWMPRPNHPTVLQTLESGHRSCEMLSNTMDALLVSGTALKHISLQTGTTHYLSLSAVSVPNAIIDCNECVQKPDDGLAFDYYALEDVLKERLNGSISWSVHRPGLLFGASYKAPFNIVGTLCVYGTICKHLGLPFLFMGSKQCWENPYVDFSDVRLVADQLVWWASQNNEGHVFEAFNAVNGIAFTWKHLWVPLIEKLGLAPISNNDDNESELMTEERSYMELMRDKGKVWEEIAEKNGLRCTKMEELANWVFIDGLFRCPFTSLASPVKAQRMGFNAVYNPVECMLYWVDRMREDKLIP